MNALKRMYHLVAGVALLNLLVAGGVAAYLVANGTLTIERLRELAAVLRPEPASEGIAAESSAGDAAIGGASSANLPTPAQRELARLNLERVTRSAEDRLKYASHMMLDIERRREELEAQKLEVAAARAATEGEADDEAFQRDLEVIALLKPKVALDNLLAREPDDAARLLQALESRTAKKIVEAASKDPRKWAVIMQIQERMRAPLDDADAEEAASAAPADSGNT